MNKEKAIWGEVGWLKKCGYGADMIHISMQCVVKGEKCGRCEQCHACIKSCSYANIVGHVLFTRNIAGHVKAFIYGDRS